MSQHQWVIYIYNELKKYQLKEYHELNEHDSLHDHYELNEHHNLHDHHELNELNESCGFQKIY